MQFSVDDYYPPEWSALPLHLYYFQIIKEGNLLGKIQIKDKEFSLIGRLEDLCDIYIDNPLVSRKHAVLQAKENDHCLYLMDLGSQHGTFVNKVKLPEKTYKKLEPFDSVKFGVSSRVYILRCPEYEKMKESQQNQRENEFVKLLEEQHKTLSKQEIKAKYLDMLENDPYFAANQGPRQLMGREQVEEQDQYAGIDWGIADERAVYAYRSQNDFPIEPDLLRRLNLDSAQLIKLSEYEDSLRRYQQVEAELNELTSKEKREFGLEEKLRNKKQKCQRKFVEALESVQKCQDWLRTNIFGQVADKNKKNAQGRREREHDTYGDDVFLDRTLEKKEAEPQIKEEVAEAETYWLLESKLKVDSQQYQKLKERLREAIQNAKSKEPVEGEEEPDELDLYMQQNKIQADNSNIQVLQREMALLECSIKSSKQKLIRIVGEEQLDKIVSNLKYDGHKSLQEEFYEKSLEEAAVQSQKKMHDNKNIEEILNKLESYQRNEEEVDEENESIFKYYKEQGQNKEQVQDLDEEQALARLRAKRVHYDPTVYQKPTQKLRIVNDRNPSRVEPEAAPAQTYLEEEEAVDLTKRFK